MHLEFGWSVAVREQLFKSCMKN